MSPAGDRGTTGQGPSGMELVGLGVALAAAVVVPIVAGVLLDGYAHTAPTFSLIGLFVGVVAGVATGYVRFKRFL